MHAEHGASGVARGSHTALRAALVALPAAALILRGSAAKAQTELSIGPFASFNETNSGGPTGLGLQSTMIVGPVGVRLSGFRTIDQSTSSALPGAPRYGGDADLLLVLNLASRGRGVGVAPYVFAGTGFTAYDDPFGSSYSGSQLITGWSYGAGLLIPLGSAAQLSGEVRERPTGYADVSTGSRSAVTEYRVGLSVRVGNIFGGRGRRAPNASRRSDSRRVSDDAARVVLGTIAVGTASSASAARVIPTAERYLGTPYRYGGTSPITGFDCSGFVQYVFAKNNVRLPRTSRQQAKVGSALPRSWRSLAPGDLVMFAERGQGISHVAIYAGSNRIIHATSSGGEVRYDDLETPRGEWFVEHMVAARRVTLDSRGLMLDLVRMLDAKSLADSALDFGDLAPKR